MDSIFYNYFGRTTATKPFTSKAPYFLVVWVLYYSIIIQLFSFIGSKLGMDYQLFSNACYYSVFSLLALFTFMNSPSIIFGEINKPLFVTLIFCFSSLLITWIFHKDNFNVSYHFNVLQLIFVFFVVLICSTKIHDFLVLERILVKINPFGTLLCWFFIIKSFLETANDENMTMAYALLVCCMLSMYFSFASSKTKIINLSLSIISVFLLFISGTRGAFLSSILFFLLMVVFTIKKANLKTKLFVCLLLLLSVACVLIFYEQIISFLFNLTLKMGFSVRIIEKLQNNSFFIDEGGRFYLQNTLFQNLERMPFFGYGILGDGYLLDGQHYAHNLFLELLIDFGWVFGILICLFLIVAFLRVIFYKDWHCVFVPISFFVFSYLFFSSSFLLNSYIWLFLGLLFSQAAKVSPISKKR